MKLLVLPLLLLLLTIFQTLRIERVVAAETPQQPPRSDSWFLAELFNVPLGERLQRVVKLRSRLKRFTEMHREFDEAAKAEYVIEAPDVVTVTLRGKKAVGRRGVKEIPDDPADYFEGKQCLVLPDGTIDLGEFGTVHVSGKTADDAMRTVAGKFIQFANSVSLSVHSYNSKVFFVIVKDADGVGNVTRMPLPYPMRRDVNVGNALAQEFAAGDEESQLPDLSKFSIYILRPAPNGVGKENKYDVEWDATHNAPSELTNYPLLPGDRIFVELTPAAALPKEADSVTDVTGSEFIIEPRFLPNVRDSRKAKPTGAEGSSEDGTNSSTPSKSHATDKAAYGLRPYDTIKLRVARPHRPAHALTWGDLEGEFTLSRDGSIYLGDDLELLQLAGMTSAEACTAIERQLREVAPECKATLELGPLASEKFFVSIQRPDGTEVAAGAMPVDASAPASMHLGSLRHWLGTAFEEADWELAEPSDSSGRKAYLPGPGDRLLIKVRADAELGLQESPPSRPNYRVTVPPPMWIEVFGKKTRGFRIAPLPGWRELYSTQFDHPDVQRPATKYSR